MPVFVAGHALAECNFDQPLGQCTGAARILQSGGSKPSYSAEVEITSSAGSCSKVEFYVGSKPYTSIIRESGSEQESLFGTSPIKKRDISVARCTAYAGAANARSSQDNNEARAEGTYQFTKSYGVFTDVLSYTLSEKNGKVTARSKHISYWGRNPGERIWSQVMGQSVMTGTRTGNIISFSDGSKLTLNGNTLSNGYNTYTK